MIQGIVLAAGRSSRFGSEKMLQTLPGGLPMMVQAARNLAPAVDALLLVVNQDQHAVIECAQLYGLKVLVSPHSRKGMGHSLADAVSATADADAWLIGLGDMPMVRPETALGVRQQLLAGHQLVAPVFSGRRGHPVGFGASMGGELQALNGDVGARKLLRRYQTRLRRIPTDDPGVVQDIDSQADFRRLLKSAQSPVAAVRHS